MPPSSDSSVLEHATLNPTLYVDELLFDWERRNVFDPSLVCVARSEELKNCGDQFAESVGETAVLYLRGADGRLRGFLNTCRHQGTQLLPCGGATNCDVVTCRGHAWTYGLDGTLLECPAQESGGVEVDKAANSLIPVATSESLGMVFSNVEAGGAFDEHVGDIDEALARYGLDGLVVAGWREYVVEANWKLVLAAVPAGADGPSHRTGSGAWHHDTGGEQVSVGVFPNLFVRANDDHCVTWLIMPKEAGVTLVLCDWTFPPERFEQTGFDPTALVEEGDTANVAAWAAAETAHRELAAGSIPGVLLTGAPAEILAERYEAAPN